MQLNLGALFPQHKYKRRNTVQLGGPAHMGKGFRDCGVRGAWVVREGFKVEAGLWWGLRGEQENVNRRKPLLRF